MVCTVSLETKHSEEEKVLKPIPEGHFEAIQGCPEMQKPFMNFGIRLWHLVFVKGHVPLCLLPHT